MYELSGGAIQAVQEVKKPTALRCSTFGAASLEERHLATGENSDECDRLLSTQKLVVKTYKAWAK